MAFMHFGNFLEGMRLSAQDIADKEKAALNERYMNEQMATMQLGRENTLLGMEETRMNMDRKPKEWQQADETHSQQAYARDLDLWAGDITGAFAAEDPAGGTGEIFKYGRDKLNEIRAKRGYAALNLDVVPDVGKDGKPTGKWALTQDGVIRGRFANEGDAHIAGAEILGGTSGVLASRVRASQERRAASGGGGPIYAENPRLDTLRASITANEAALDKKRKQQADPVFDATASQATKDTLQAEIDTLAAQTEADNNELRDLLAHGYLYNRYTAKPAGGTPLPVKPRADAKKPAGGKRPAGSADDHPVGKTIRSPDGSYWVVKRGKDGHNVFQEAPRPGGSHPAAKSGSVAAKLGVSLD